MKKIKSFLFIIIAYIPAVIIAFILGGLDAVCGTYTYDRFYQFIHDLYRRCAL
jgi:hypothetical protein